MIAYKLFKIKNGKLYPLYVNANKEIPMNVWLSAEAGPKTENGKVKSKLGELAYRPGFHLTEVPFADHIGKKMKAGGLCQKKDTVWCEVEFPDNDITEQVRAGVKSLRDACMKTVPVGAYYRYKTNPNAKVDWFIAGEMRVIRMLSQYEVNHLCMAKGVIPQITEEEYDLIRKGGK